MARCTNAVLHRLRIRCDGNSYRNASGVAGSTEPEGELRLPYIEPAHRDEVVFHSWMEPAENQLVTSFSSSAVGGRLPASL